MPFVYFDAARMGLTSPSAQLALHDFVRFSGENGCSLYFDRLLQRGFAGWPHSLQMRYPGLKTWAGLGEMFAAAAKAVTLPEEGKMLLAGRSAALVRLGARVLFRHAKRVLTVDLLWPEYARILGQEQRKAGGEVVTLPLRALALAGKLSAEEITEEVVRRALAANCTGLVLPHVSQDGILLPVEAICSALRDADGLRFALIDGAQAFGHVPVTLNSGAFDFYLCGTHKWLGAYLLLGIGFAPNVASMRALLQASGGFARSGLLDDPLGAFLHQLRTNDARPFSETVNLAPLFSLRAALADAFAGEGRVGEALTRRHYHAAMLRRILPYTGWSTLDPHASLRSAIVMLQSQVPFIRNLGPGRLRSFFLAQNVSLSCYGDGLVRAAMPAADIDQTMLDTITAAFYRSGWRARADVNTFLGLEKRAEIDEMGPISQGQTVCFAENA